MAKPLEHALKWLLPALIVVEIVLVWTGWLDLGTAIGVTVAVEVLLVVVAGRQFFVAVRGATAGSARRGWTYGTHWKTASPCYCRVPSLALCRWSRG